MAIQVVGRPLLPCPGPIISQLVNAGHIPMMLVRILRARYTILTSGVNIGLRQAGTLKLLVHWNVHIFLEFLNYFSTPQQAK